MRKTAFALLIALLSTACADSIVQPTIEGAPTTTATSVRDAIPAKSKIWEESCVKPIPPCSIPGDVAICVIKADGEEKGVSLNMRYEWECFPLDWLQKQ